MVCIAHLRAYGPRLSQQHGFLLYLQLTVRDWADLATLRAVSSW